MPLSPSFPELAALDLYASVVEHGSLGAAARAHNIAQPSASSRIKNLERQLGVQLLERSPTGSKPTPVGVVVAGWADAILRAAGELDAGLTALKAEEQGRLRIAASYTIAEYLLPSWLGRFLAEHPEDTVSLDVENSTAVLRGLEAGHADLGFIESPVDVPEMDQQVVASDRLVAVTSPFHPWARTSTISLAELAATPLVMREEGSGTRDALVAAIVDAGHGEPHSVLELGSTSAVRSAVITGNAPTVISRLAVADDLAAGRLVEIAIDGLEIVRDLRAVWLRRHPLPRPAADLLRSLRAGSEADG